MNSSPHTLALKPFTNTSTEVNVTGSIERTENSLTFSFEISDPTKEIVHGLQPGNFSGAMLKRVDGLWQTTCLEAFWGIPGDSTYWELNLSPRAPEYAVYRFADYRTPQPPASDFGFRLEFLSVNGPKLIARLVSQTPLPPVLECNLTAIIATKTENFYFARTHRSEKADFHHRAAFQIRI